MQHETFHFPPFELVPGVNLLYKSGAPVPLEPRAVQVLSYLVRHRDRVVPKEELLDQVWADVFTTDAVLKQAVSQARRALGDTHDAPNYIQTFHARGYRFIAPVTVRTGHDAQDVTGSSVKPTPDVGDKKIDTASTAGVSAVVSLGHADAPNYDLLVGRDAELSLLRAEFGRALEGGGQPVLVRGEPGIGKTQLARHFGRWARAQGAAHVYARFFDYEGSRLAPYEVVIGLLNSALDAAREPQEPVVARARTARELREEVEARCSVLLPEELSGAEGRREPLARVGTGDHFRIIVPLGDAFLRLARERPLVLALDDLQWADEVSLDFIGYLMRARTSEPLLLLLLARAEETLEASQRLSAWLKRQAGYRSFTAVSLGPLGEDACGAALEEAFGGAASAPLIPRSDTCTMHRVTGGNPYFLMETLRLLVAEGVVSGAGAGAGVRWQWHGIEDVPLPDSLTMAALAKLERLPTELLLLLEHAAVIGDEFRVETLARMAGRDPEALDESLGEAVRLGVLSARSVSAGEDYRFHHTILRRVLYDNLPVRRRRRLHLLAASAIEDVHARHTDRLAEALSAHYEAGGEPLRAFRWAMRAWAAASARWHWNEAVSCAERARRAAEQVGFDDTAPARAEAFETDAVSTSVSLAATEKLSMLLALGESLHAVGRNRESEPVLREALAVAGALGDERARAAALFQSGLVNMSLSQYREAQSFFEAALEIYRRAGDVERERLTVVQLGSIRAGMGEYEAAGQLIEEVLGGAGVAEETAASAAGVLGWARALQGRYAEGVELLRRALEYHTRCGNVRLRAHVLRRLHWADLSRGQYESAIALARQAQRDFHTIGDAFGEAKTFMGIGQARIAQGLYDEGISYLRRTLESLKTNGDAHCEAETLWLLGRAHCEAGRTHEADSLLARALEMIRVIGDRDDEFRILVDQARVELARGNTAAALAKATEAAKIAAELHCRDGLGFALVEQAHSLHTSGEHAAAKEAAREAVRLLEETGSGERWRGYWALALGARRVREAHEKTIDALRRTVELLDDIRAQFSPSDSARREEMTRARRAPAQLLIQTYLSDGRTDEAKALGLAWSLKADSEQ